MIDKILSVAVAGVQAARSGLAACFFKSKSTKKLCRKGLCVALLGVSALSVTHMASATLITVEAGVVANTGYAVTFAPFDIGLGTLTGAQITYRFTALYNFFNDDDVVAASEWDSNALLMMTHWRGQQHLTGTESHGLISTEDAKPWVSIEGANEVIDIELVEREFKIAWDAYDPTVPGLGDWVTIPNGILYEANTAFAQVLYTYDDGAATTPGSVPEPSTLAIFALGMIGLASRRFKKQS